MASLALNNINISGEVSSKTKQDGASMFLGTS